MNIFYIFVIMCSINIIIDIIIVRFEKSTGGRQKPAETANFEQAKIYGNVKEKHIVRKLVILALLVIVVYICLFVFNQREYAVAGYYDFEVNQQRTVADLFQDKKISAKQCPESIFTSFKDTPLCEKKGNPAWFSLIMIETMDQDGKTSRLIPYFDKTSRRYYFIENNLNMQNLADISPGDTIISISRIEKYKKLAFLPFTNILTSFRLQADTSADIFSAKPLYLIVPFYLFYVMTLLLVVFLFTVLVYECIVQFHYTSGRIKKYLYIPGKICGEILLFLNTCTLVVVFFMINRLVEKYSHITWINKTFTDSFFSYVLIQLVIALMFSGTYINELILYVMEITGKDEFKYYTMIGLNNKNQRYIFNKKYGRNLLLKLVFQNILFVININWFIAYAFNVWKTKLRDFIGVTYAISFENIFTKIIHFESVNTGLYNFLLLALLDTALFAGYYYYEKKLSKR